MKLMISFLLVVLALVSGCSEKYGKAEQALPAEKQAEGPSLPALWTVGENIMAPESATLDPKSGFLFVSNVVGSPVEKDGQGWISKLSPDGKMLQSKWVSGLNAPKGMRADGDSLWVTDIDQVVEIQITTGKILSRTPVKGAKFLNDIGVGPDHEVYVSDMMTNKILLVKRGKVSTFFSGTKLESPNGLLVSEGRLYVATWGKGIKPDFSTTEMGHLLSIELKSKKLALVTPKPVGHLDGLERMANGDFLVSDWMAGKIFRVRGGEASVVASGFKGSADIGWNENERVLFVPRMGENLVSAFRLPL